MLFPTEEEYMEWYTKAGFTDVKITRIGPKWYRGVRRHGLIMGCSVTGVKPQVRGAAGAPFFEEGACIGVGKDLAGGVVMRGVCGQ
jgi:hypothetical protein